MTRTHATAGLNRLVDRMNQVDGNRFFPNSLRPPLKQAGLFFFPFGVNTASQNPSINLLMTHYRNAGLNGINVIKQIKKLRPTLPVIMISADDLIEDDALQNGADAFLTKPAFFEELINLIQTFLEINSAPLDPQLDYLSVGHIL